MEIFGLQSCYVKWLEYAKDKKFKSLSFCIQEDFILNQYAVIEI